MPGTAKKFEPERPARAQTVTIETSLYEMIQVFLEELGDDHEKLVTRLVCDLIESGQLRSSRQPLH